MTGSHGGDASAYAETRLQSGLPLSVTIEVMKINSRPVRLLFATAVLGLLSASAYAGPGIHNWQRTTPVTTFSEAKKVCPDDMVMMQCNHCKTAMVGTCKEMGVMSKDHPEWCMVGAKCICPECHGEMTVVQGKGDDSMQINCSKCGEGAVNCCTVKAEK